MPSTTLDVIGNGRFTKRLIVNEGIYADNTYGNAVEGYGNSTSGIGVYGTGYYGVYGLGSTFGVYGSSSNYGVYGAGAHTGAYGSGAVYGVRGYSDGGWGV